MPTWEIGDSGLPHRDLGRSMAQAFRVWHDDGTEIAAFGIIGSRAANLFENHEAASDSRGNVYVSDYNRVQRFKMSPESR